MTTTTSSAAARLGEEPSTISTSESSQVLNAEEEEAKASVSRVYKNRIAPTLTGCPSFERHPSESSRNFLPDFTGSWRVRDVENLDALLAAAGAPWIFRKLLSRSFSKASMRILQKKSVLYVEDKSIPKDRKTGSLKFVEGVDLHRKDAYGFKITERCTWGFDQDLGSWTWTLETHGYHPGKGPITSRYYYDLFEKDVLVAEVSFEGVMMKRKWVREDRDQQKKNTNNKTKMGHLAATENGKGGLSRNGSKETEASAVLEDNEMIASGKAMKVLLYGKRGWLACQVGLFGDCQRFFRSLAKF